MNHQPHAVIAERHFPFRRTWPGGRTPSTDRPTTRRHDGRVRQPVASGRRLGEGVVAFALLGATAALLLVAALTVVISMAR